MNPTASLQPTKSKYRFFQLEGAIAGAAMIFCILLVLVPLAALFYTAFRTGSPGDPAATYTLENWATLAKPSVLKAALNTFKLATVATLGSLTLGITLAWLIARTDLPWRSGIQILAVVPMLVSPLLTTLAWIALAGPNAGLINAFWTNITGASEPLFNIYSFAGMSLLMILHYTPFVFLLMLGGLLAVDSSLEDAARTHGAGVWLTLRRVVLPVLAPTLLAAGLLVFVLSSENFTIPALLGATTRYFTIQYLIYSAVAEYPSDPGLAAVLGTLLLVVTVSGIWLQQRMRRFSKRFVTITGKSVRQRRIELRAFRYPALLFCLLYITLAIGLPLLTLIFGSFLRYMTPELSFDLLTTKNYAYVFSQSDAVRSLRNSLTFALLGATLTLLFSAVLSFLIVRGKSRLTRGVEFLSAMPLSIPGLALALGMLWGYIYLPVGLYGTIWVLILAYMTRYMSFGVRIFSSGVAQIDPELEEAARVSGCSQLQTFSKVTMPILRPAAASAWTLLFMQIILELPVTIILYTGGSVTAPVSIWRMVYGSTIEAAYAMATLLLLIGAVVLVIGQRLFGTLRYLGSGD